MPTTCDFAAARQVFKEAQRLQPDNVSLSHLEVLLLICEPPRRSRSARQFLDRAAQAHGRLRRPDRAAAAHDRHLRCDSARAMAPQPPVELEQLKTLAAQLPPPQSLYRLEVRRRCRRADTAAAAGRAGTNLAPALFRRREIRHRAGRSAVRRAEPCRRMAGLAAGQSDALQSFSIVEQPDRRRHAAGGRRRQLAG